MRFEEGDMVRVVKDTMSLKKGDLYTVTCACTNPRFIDDDKERCIEVVSENGRREGKYYGWKFELVTPVKPTQHFSDDDFIL